MTPRRKTRIPDEKKKKALKLATEHPTWSLKQISQNSGLKCIKSYRVLHRWAGLLKIGKETILYTALKKNKK